MNQYPRVVYKGVDAKLVHSQAEKLAAVADGHSLDPLPIPEPVIPETFTLDGLAARISLLEQKLDRMEGKEAKEAKKGGRF